MTPDKGYNVTKHHEHFDKLTHPDAQVLNGAFGGFQPKPAVEEIIVAMKPLSEKTFVDQALKNGKGVTWLDDCKIPIFDLKSEPGYRPNAKKHKFHQDRSGFKMHRTTGTRARQDEGFYSSQGRFPANLLVSDDVLDDSKNHKSGRVSQDTLEKSKMKEGFLSGQTNLGSTCEASSGSFSRFFSLDSWFAEKLKELPESGRKTFPFLLVPKPSKKEKNLGCGLLPLGEPPATARSKPAVGRTSPLGKPRHNFHPTCKPIKLMSYLITLGSRKFDTILDPFVGSGTTLCAAVMLRRNSIGIELSEEYVKIAKARVKYFEDLFR